MKKYTIGVDFGTLSARAVLLDTDSGKEVSSAEFVYPHAVMSDKIPCGTALEADVALQHPQDYIDGLCYTVKKVVELGGVTIDEVVGIGIDFTACTVLPVDGSFTPLCLDEKFKNIPYAMEASWGAKAS